LTRKRLQYPSVSRVINVPVPYPVVPGGDFSAFDLIQSRKAKQLDSFTNTVYLPTVAAAFQPYVFSQFNQPQSFKTVQDYDFDDLFIRAPSVPVVFSTFSQPQVKVTQQSDSLNTPFVTPVVVTQNYIFLPFDQPKQVKAYQENNFGSYSAVDTPVVFQPYLFSTFEQPRKSVRQDTDVQFTVFPPTQVVVTQPYVFGQFSQPQPARGSQVGFTNTVQPTLVQTYVFSTFSQPLIKKQINDQPTWFGSPVVSQPYVFSAFSQPQPVRYQTDANVQTSYYPIVVIPLPNFIGFNDFGLAQQLLGTQQKQDGGYVQFTVLPMPQVISPYFFTGFSDFATMLLTKQNGLVGRNTDQPNVVLQPIIPPPFPSIGPGGTKRWKEGYEQLRTGTAPLPIPIVSSNLSSIVYDEDSKELTVEFKTYKYEKVPAKKVRGLLSAGGYFQQNIKGKYPTTRIK